MAAVSDVTEKFVSFRLAAFVALLSACLSGGVGASVSAYAIRDKALADIQSSIKLAVQVESSARADQLRHFVSREEWLEWRRAEGEKRDTQFFELKELILRRK